MSITFVENQTIKKDFQLASAVTPGYHLVHLNSGWNEIIYDGAPIDVSETGIANLVAIYHYTGSEWLVYLPTLPPEQCNLKTMEYGKTYQINVGIVQDWKVANYTPPPTNYLAMSKAELFPYLTNGAVARDWWSLSYDDRRALGLEIIQWWSYDYCDYQAIARAYGGANGVNPPNHSPWHNPELNIGGKIGLGMECASAYRHSLFSNISPSNVPNNVYWYKGHGTAIDSDTPEYSKDEGPYIWKCYELGVRFNLPMGVAIGDADWLNCLQVGEDVSKLESWIFFQTWLIDGYPGCDAHHWPIRNGNVKIYNVAGINKGLSQPGMTDLGSMIVVISY